MSKKKEEMIDDEIEFVDEPEIVVLKGSDGREEELLLLAEIDYGGWVEQTYLPESIKDAQLYKPSKNGKEKDLVRAKVIKANKG